jgi:hypothetical protein
MMLPRFSSLLLPGSVLVIVVMIAGCRSPEEERRDAARLDSLRRDSLRPVDNPYKLPQGNDQYNRQRETLGNLDSLVTPPQPSIPGH